MTSIDNLVLDGEKNAFYTDEIMKLCDGKVKIVRYQDLYKYKNIDDLLKPYNACIILIETQENFGHWTALLKYKQDGRWTVEHFDSYGLSPDDELKFVPDSMKRKLGEDHPKLTEFLYKSPYKVVYNKYKLQELKKGVNTCGRWCGLRVVFKDIPLKKFIEAFKNSKRMSPDEWVVALTSFIDKKRSGGSIKGGNIKGKRMCGGDQYIETERDRVNCVCSRKLN